MPLTGPQFEELNGEVVAAFNEQSLAELMRYKLGADMFKEFVSPGPLKTIVFQLTTALDQIGLLANFIKAVLEARPLLDNLQTKLKGLLASISDHTASASEQVNAVKTGVAQVEGQIQLAEVRKVVQAAEAFLNKLVDDISLLRAYKALHDALHFLQMQLRGLAAAGRNVGKDPYATGDLQQSVTSLRLLAVQTQSCINDLPEIPPAIRAIEALWLTRLNQAIDLGSECARTSDPTLGRQSAYEIRSLLRQEPPRIDGILSLTAGSLDLSRLKGVFAEAAAQTGVPPTMGESLLKSQLAAEQLLRQLKALLNQHSQWQWIDRNLWEADDNLPKSGASDPSDFFALWSRIQANLTALAGTEPEAAWAKRITDGVAQIETQRTAEDWSKLTVHFGVLRQECIVQFFVIDTNLKALAGEVATLGASLRSLIGSLAP